MAPHMPHDDSAAPPEPSSPGAADDPMAAVRTRRFAFVLLAYAVATVAIFALFSRHFVRLTALYGHDIESAPLQWGLYLGLFIIAPIAGAVVAGRVGRPRRRETQLRWIFLAGATLAIIVGLYQGRFGAPKLWAFGGVGVLGTFIASLLVTWREWGLVETIARPREDLVRHVAARHAGVVVASSTWDYVKRAIDLIFAMAILIVSLPISVPLAVLVWLQDPGPLLVAKFAVGRGGTTFRQLKLRSMVKDAERDTGPVPAAPQDTRVTALGGWLRRTHIDELPQMLNILAGQMSLVGPRPERTVFVRRHLERIPRYANRHAVRPGLAGLAQVYGDYYSTPREKLHYDLFYIRRRGPALDAHLFLAALGIAFLGIDPRRGRHARRRHHRRDDRAYRRAYDALRGDEGGDG